jgi:hypothetical protein
MERELPMALENKSLKELTALKVQLLKRINYNPDHSAIVETQKHQAELGHHHLHSFSSPGAS